MKIFFSQPKEKNSVPTRNKLVAQSILIKDWRNIKERQVNNNIIIKE
jgi:hypothetical protein